MPHSAELVADGKQIELLFRFMVGFNSTEHLNEDEVKVCKHLIAMKFLREIPWEGTQRIITTLDGVSLFRRYYNAVSKEEAIERHAQELSKQKKEST